MKDKSNKFLICLIKWLTWNWRIIFCNIYTFKNWIFYTKWILIWFVIVIIMVQVTIHYQDAWNLLPFIFQQKILNYHEKSSWYFHTMSIYAETKFYNESISQQ
jgi:hypothetical protein